MALKIEGVAGLRPCPPVYADRVVIYAHDQITPLAVVVELTAGQYFVAKAGDPDFDKALENLGVSRSVVVTDYTPTPVTDYR